MSKQIVEGTIDKLTIKDLPEADAYGNSYAVSVNIGGQWYGLGRKKKPAANIKNGQGWHQLAEGDQIEAVCNVVEKGDRTYYNIKASDITLKEAGSGATRSNSPVANRGSAGSVSVSKPVGGDDRQDAIMRQSAMGYAAQIVAGTLTAKSDLDKAAAEVVRLANDYLVPYAKHGITETQKKEEELSNQNQAAHASSEEDFNDDIPF